MRFFLMLGVALGLTACFGGGGAEWGPSRATPPGMGEVCGTQALTGRQIAPVRHPSQSACGFTDAVEIYSVAGVTLSGQTRLTCTAARALADWVQTSAQPQISRAAGGRLARIDSWSTFRCTKRGGGKWSEHAKGNAIDIGGFATEDGGYISVKEDWGSRRYGKALRRVKDGACGPFGVVLHPGNDPGAHADHFHLDISYRSGHYVHCRRNP